MFRHERYYCNACQANLEILQKGKAKRKVCPVCGASALEWRFPVPALRTGASLMRGRGMLLNQLKGDERELNLVLSAAHKHGFRPNPHAVYMKTMARFKGDPEAFIPAEEGEAYVKRLLRKRGWGNEELGVHRVEKPPPKSVKVAADIVERVYRKRIKQDPSLKAKPPREVKEAIIDQFARKGA